MNNSNGRIEFFEIKSGKTIMWTDGKGRIGVNTSKQPIDDPQKASIYGKTNYHMDIELLNACNKIAKGQKLTPLEESSIVALWHEILHNRQKESEKFLVEKRCVEGITDWVAVHTYDTFLNDLGGQVEHKEIIKDYRIGYGHYIRDIKNYIKLHGLNEDDMLQEMLRIINNIDCSGYKKEILNWGNKNSRK
ncbi:MAG: hypothetical protein LBH05_01620 [Deferribacteraceae bacterium]|jgi:hypothetical protein|nr:hypothetical protein [Deferribacteraceae bacterium]